MDLSNLKPKNKPSEFLVIRRPEDTDHFELDFDKEPYFLTNRQKNQPLIEVVQDIKATQGLLNKDSLFIAHEKSLEIAPFFIFKKNVNGKVYFLTFKYHNGSNNSNANLFRDILSASDCYNKSIFLADRIWNVDVKKTLSENLSEHVYEVLRSVVVFGDNNEYKVEDLVTSIDLTIKPSGNKSSIRSQILGLGFVIDLTDHFYDSQTLKHMSPNWEDMFTIKTELIVDNMLNQSSKLNSTNFTYDRWSSQIATALL